MTVDELPARRAAIAAMLRLAETSQDALAAAEGEAIAARARYLPRLPRRSAQHAAPLATGWRPPSPPSSPR